MGPFSEPETQAIAGLIKRNKESIKAYVSVHSYGPVVGYPYGYSHCNPVSPKNLPQLVTISFMFLGDFMLENSLDQF